MARVILGIYKHYKGGLYNVIAIGRDASTTREMVVYHPMGDPKYNSGIWIRSAKEFNECMELTHDENVKRFSFVRESYFSNLPGFK